LSHGWYERPSNRGRDRKPEDDIFCGKKLHL
jgi:hypothetical protein